MYWNIVQSKRSTSFQKALAEKRSAITAAPPATSTEPVATTPPTLWYIGRQL